MLQVIERSVRLPCADQRWVLSTRLLTTRRYRCGGPIFGGRKGPQTIANHVCLHGWGPPLIFSEQFFHAGYTHTTKKWQGSLLGGMGEESECGSDLFLLETE